MTYILLTIYVISIFGAIWGHYNESIKEDYVLYGRIYIQDILVGFILGLFPIINTMFALSFVIKVIMESNYKGRNNNE